MMYDSLQIFLANFCTPEQCSVKGMSFTVKRDLCVGWTEEEVSVCLFIDADYSQLVVTLTFEREKLIQKKVEIPIVEADFKRVMAAIKALTDSYYDGKY